MKQIWPIFKIRKKQVVTQWYLVEHSLGLNYYVYLNYFIIQNIIFIIKSFLRKTYFHTVPFIYLYITNCVSFVFASFQSTFCPSLPYSALGGQVFKFSLMTVFWLGQANGSHCQIVLEWSKRPQCFFHAPFFLLYRVSGSTCMPSDHSSKALLLSEL